MPSAEFDQFARTYRDTHAENVRLSGEAPEYFARYKIEILRQAWSRRRGEEPRRILDFGTGVGASIPHLAALFPAAQVLGVDVSPESLALAQRDHGFHAQFELYDGGRLPLADGSVDLVFTACVFHHIPPSQHVALFGEIRRVLSPGGLVMVFEHNPVNPVTRYIVATCPFDRDAILLPAGALRQRQEAAGLKVVERRYTGFFPAALKALRPAEPWLGALPLGAQYYTVATP